MKITHAAITNARETLALPEKASFAAIRQQYRRLLLRWHPDTCTEEPEFCEKKTREITAAYQLLRQYCDEFEFCFSEEELSKIHSAEEWWLKRFGNAPWWG